MSTPAIDYDALAAQHGGAPVIDYDALAAAQGGSAVSTAVQAPPTGTISAVPEPTSFAGKLTDWASKVTNDIKYGTDETGIGTLLQKMGAHGVYSGNSQAVGDFMASLPLGLARMTQGAGETGQGQIKQGAKDIGAGALEASTIPASFAAPEVGEGSANALESAVDKVSPSAMKEAAGGLLQSVAHDANKLPVALDNAGDAALRLMDWQKKTQLGPTINKFLNRITNPKLGQLTYEEGRDFYQLLGNMSADEKLRLAPTIKRDLTEMVAGLKSDLGNTADQAGHAADYYAGLKQYAKAMRLQDWYENALKIGKKAALGAGATAGAAVIAREVWDLTHPE